MTDDFAAIEKLASAMLARVTSGERRRLLRTIAREVQKSQRARIRRQQDPDGAAFTPRREKAPPKPGSHALKFLYPKGEVEPRLVLMKSWVRQGALVTGFDVEKGAIRSFFWDKIARFLPVTADEDNASAGGLAKKGRIRQRAMFRKLSSARFLRAGASDNEAWVGFEGQAAAIARVHQDGLRDKPSPKAKPVQYAQRRLLGLSSADQTMVMNMLLDHVSGA